MFIELARITRELYTEHTHSSSSGPREVCIFPKKKLPWIFIPLDEREFHKKFIFSLNLKLMQNSAEYLVLKFLNYLFGTEITYIFVAEACS